MGKKVFKVLLAVAVVTALSAGTGDDADARTRRTTPPPHIVQQKQAGDKRLIYVHNTLNKPIWGFFECEHHLTQIPLDLAANRVTEVVLPDIGADEQCMLNHYRIQVRGQSPDPWIPNAYETDGGVQ